MNMNPRKVNVLVVLALMATVLFTPGCDDDDCIEGTGSIVTVEINLPDIEGIKSTGSFDINLMQGAEQYIEARGQQNIIDMLNLTVAGGIWDASLTNDCYRNFELEIFVTVPDLESVEMTGSGNLNFTSFDSLDNLEIITTGSGDILQIGNFTASGVIDVLSTGSGNLDMGVEANRLLLTKTGSGNMAVNGSVSLQDIVIEGSGNHLAFLLESDTCDIIVSGSGNAEVTVQDLLNVNITGSGNVIYKGNPVINSQVTGSGSVIDGN